MAKVLTKGLAKKVNDRNKEVFYKSIGTALGSSAAAKTTTGIIIDYSGKSISSKTTKGKSSKRSTRKGTVHSSKKK